MTLLPYNFMYQFKDFQHIGHPVYFSNNKSLNNTVSLTYKRADAAVDRDRDDRGYRWGLRRTSVLPDGADGARAGTAENRNGPASRPRQLRCVCWFQRVWQLSCTRRESLRVSARASIAPGKEKRFFFFVSQFLPARNKTGFLYIRQVSQRKKKKKEKQHLSV